MSSMTGREKQYDTDRGRLATLEWGPENGFPIIALHGWMDNAASFLPLAEHLDLQQYRLIAMDLPGHGKSAHRPEGDTYNLLEYTLDVVRLLDTLQLSSVHLLGHSLGGVISALVAAAAPERVDCCVFLDALGPMANHENQTVSQLKKAVHYFLKPKAEALLPFDFESAVSARTGVPPRLDTSSAEMLMFRNLRKVDGGYRYRSDSRLRSPSLARLTEGQIQDILSSINAPVLLVVPEHGLVSPDKKKNPRLSLVRNLTVLNVPGKHHFHMESGVPELAKAINAYYADNSTHIV